MDLGQIFMQEFLAEKGQFARLTETAGPNRELKRPGTHGCSVDWNSFEE
jgi:hypothetical protein